MPPQKKRRTAREKKPVDEHEHLGARVTGYKLDIKAGLSLDLKSGGVRYPEPADPVYTYGTTIALYGEGVFPDERAGEIYDFLIVGDARAAKHRVTIADIQDRDRYDGPKTRLYRGVEIPVFERPAGIAIMFPGGGKRHFQTYLPVPPELASDMLTALATGAAPYMAIHEHKVGRKRWIDTLTLQNTHPAEE